MEATVLAAASLSSSWLENLSLSSDRKRAIEELIKGQELALQLRNHINKSTKNEGSQVNIITQDLVSNILSSFTNSISILKNGDSNEVSQVQALTQLSSPCSEASLKPVDSGKSRKRTTIKDRKGCDRRSDCRLCAESWTKHSSSLIDDGYTWRKYGQKAIHNAKFLRNYFRCTYKYDQGCQASKHVQRIEEEPSVYRTTYYGHHTCKNLPKASQIIIDSTASDDQSPMISFGSTHTTEQDFNSFFSSFPSIQDQSKDHDHDQAPSDMTQIHNQSSSSDGYHVPPPAFESTANAYSLDMAVDFDDVWSLNFDA